MCPWSSSTEVLIIMSSPGQKRGTCGHVIAVFDGHLKCARCRDKGVGDDPCVLKKTYLQGFYSRADPTPFNPHLQREKEQGQEGGFRLPHAHSRGPFTC